MGRIITGCPWNFYTYLPRDKYFYLLFNGVVWKPGVLWGAGAPLCARGSICRWTRDLFQSLRFLIERSRGVSAERENVQQCLIAD